MAAASAEAAQAPSLLLSGGAVLIGPEPFQALADLRTDVEERTMVMAANRLIGLAAALIVVGSILALTGVLDLAGFLVGTGRG